MLRFRSLDIARDDVPDVPCAEDIVEGNAPKQTSRIQVRRNVRIKEAWREC